MRYRNEVAGNDGEEWSCIDERRWKERQRQQWGEDEMVRRKLAKERGMFSFKGRFWKESELGRSAELNVADEHIDA
jgi:hypothetical protein